MNIVELKAEQQRRITDLEIIVQTLCEPGDIVELRYIRGKAPKAEVKKEWSFAKDLSNIAGKLQSLNQQNYNLYFGPNPRKQFNQSGDNNVKLARCLFCDFDNIAPGDGCGRLEFIWNDIFIAGLPEPTLAIHSGHGLHVYWRLDEPILDMTVWKKTQAGLNAKLKADPSIKNPERIMRMPRFMNTKKQPYQECFVCWSPVHGSY